MYAHIPVIDNCGKEVGTLFINPEASRQICHFMQITRVYLGGIADADTGGLLQLQLMPEPVSGPINVDPPPVETRIKAGDRVRLRGCLGPHMIVTYASESQAKVVWFDVNDQLQEKTLSPSILDLSPIITPKSPR